MRRGKFEEGEVSRYWQSFNSQVSVLCFTHELNVVLMFYWACSELLIDPLIQRFILYSAPPTGHPASEDDTGGW